MAHMMEKDPQKRIQTAAEVAARLEPWSREAAPLPSQQLTKSPWMPPPLPTDADDDQLQDTDAGSEVYDNGDSRQGSGSGSQISQPTYTAASAGQDTRRLRRVAPPPLPGQRTTAPSVTASVLITLAIAVPISMLVGSLLTFLLLAALG